MNIKSSIKHRTILFCIAFAALVIWATIAQSTVLSVCALFLFILWTLDINSSTTKHLHGGIKNAKTTGPTRY